MTKNWHVIEVVARRERLAESSIRSLNLDAFVPMINADGWNGFTRRKREQAFFKGYGFARFDAKSDDYYRVRWSAGVAGVLDFGSGPPVVDEALIEAIAGRVGDDGFVRLDSAERRAANASPFAPGEDVLIDDVENPFNGFPAIFQADYKDDRAIVLMTILGAERRVEVARTSLRPLTFAAELI